MRDGLLAANRIERLLDEPLHALVAVEVRLDVRLRGPLVDAELSRKAERADAVDDSEVDGLGAAAGLLVHRGCVNAEDLARSQRVDVLAGAVRVEQQRVLREVRHQTQLDLRVVCRHQHITRRGDECSANLPAHSGADGNVLQVRIRTARAGPSRCRPG